MSILCSPIFILAFFLTQWHMFAECVGILHNICEITIMHNNWLYALNMYDEQKSSKHRGSIAVTKVNWRRIQLFHLLPRRCDRVHHVLRGATDASC